MDLPHENPVTIITLPTDLDYFWVEKTRLFDRPEQALVLDFSATKRLDSAALCAIRLLQEDLKARNGRLVLRNVSEDLLSLLENPSKPLEISARAPRSPEGGFFALVGDRLIGAKESCIAALSVLAEMLYWGTIGILKKREFRRGVVGEQMYLLGYKALGIVGLLSFLIGMVLAIQVAMQLKDFGASVFLGPLIGITMIREMGPILTAVILAGRTGSATTAEIGTMGVGEELDALRTMGINPIQFIVVPKFWALSLTMPVLSTLGTGAGILGGWLVGIFYLGLSSSTFWGQLSENLHAEDVFTGLIKSVVFSWLIIWIGAYYGFRVRGSAESVGRETTASVVACIFIIIVADAAFSFIL
jgi:phospholipid/cholesterol/gamma-HCH transport system permease protein